MVNSQPRVEKLATPLPMDADERTSDGKYILIVDGAFNAAAGTKLGYFTIDRLSATGGLGVFIPFLRDRNVVVVGENDDGAGRKEVKNIALGLCGAAKSVRIVYPLEGAKDLRDWYSAPAGCTRLELDSAIAAAHVLTPLLLLTSSFVTLEGGLAR